MSGTIEIAGKQYQVGKLDAMRQFHVTRRLAPALWAGLTMVAGADGAKLSQDVLLSEFRPIAQAVADLSDADSEYVIRTCLSVVSRNEGGQWARVTTPDGALMFGADMDMTVMLQLVAAVVKDNLANFFDALATMSGAQLPG